MCGIAGKLAPSPNAPIDRDLLVAMADAVSHRGPDADGFYVGEGVGLAHRRLSIVDVATGQQPLANEDKTVWVVFNGEIYNFPSLRVELESHGHRFRTHSDTEVIVHAYEQWGERCVERFRGMFAFALWDARNRRLLLARDRVGIKPVYYAVPAGGGLVFGSEIKSILEDPAVDASWSPEAVDAYLTLLYVPSPNTIYQQIRKLPAGHVLVAERGSVRVSKYWDLEFTGTGNPADEARYLDELDALLTESVKMRLMSEVPLGAFLSGGIDSTTVVAYMAKTSASQVLATSVGFEDKEHNEIDKARRVAQHLGCRLATKLVDPQIEELLPRLAWHFDEPFGDSSAVPTYYVSAAARERVTVALSGDGGDELWAGYPWHRVELWESRVRGRLGAAGCDVASRLGHLLPLSAKGARSLRHLGLPPDHACARKHGYQQFDDAAKRELYSGDLASATRGADPFGVFRAAYASCQSADPMDRVMYVDVKTYLVDDILTKVDKMSMAVSLEARVPLLDHKLIEFAARVPSSLKLRRGVSKYLLKQVLHRHVPPAVFDGPKHGFTAPIAQWLRGPLKSLAAELLMDGRLEDRGLFRPAAVARLWQEHQQGRRNHCHRLWSLVMLELWFRQFADGARRAAAA
ncbi:MAG TPA: asparagine synthase (glutamine-hydrolyzing) [Vicinamibacterales bacterium]|jgi:asparagine synthase (glutamine-hydrolysing)